MITKSILGSANSLNRYKMHKLLITCILVFTPFEGSKAGEANLSMNLTGSIYPPPIWVDPYTQDGGGEAEDPGDGSMTWALLDFSSNRASGNESRNVDTTEIQVSLSNLAVSGQTLSVTVTTPSGCSIGANPVDDQHVKILIDSGAEHRSSEIVSLVEGTAHLVKVRFSSSGNYGALTGEVRCTSSGALSYSY